MMYTEIRRKTYPAPAVREDEILRYAGCRDASDEMSALVSECLSMTDGKLNYAVCSRSFKAEVSGDICDIGFAKIKSSSLSALLCGCDEVVVFAATLGIELDRLIARYGRIAPSKALVLQATGAERIEALCDTFCGDIAEEAEKTGRQITRRFSPGYGDVPLELQRDIIAVTDAVRQIGVTLNDSLLMSPSKSVTAIIGIGECEQKQETGKCRLCGNINCPYRRI